MNGQSELVRYLRDRLTATEEELAEQKWAFEQFLRSPSWRWTAPVRWAVKQFRKLSNGHHSPTSPAVSSKTAESVNGVEANSVEEAKVLFTNLCQISLQTFLDSGATLDLPQSPTPEISIVLVLFNRAELTLACLRSIAETRNAQIEIVIVDNASSDRTAQLLNRLRGARIIANDTNLHFLEGANQAARECRGEYILLLNNDAQLLPGALRSALRTIRESPDVGAVGGKIILLDGTLQEAGSIVWHDGSCAGYGRGDDPFAPMYTFRRDVDYCSGAFLLTPRKLWDQLGGFDKTFAPAYYEETDYCLRLWQLGYRVVYEPDAAIVHYEFASSKSAAAATGLQARNQKVFAERHRAVLEKRQRQGKDPMLQARARNAERRALCVVDRVDDGLADCRALAKQGYFVTLYPLIEIDEPRERVYAELPREVEIMTGRGREKLEHFLESRKGYYSTMIVSPERMEALTSCMKAHPDWFEHVRLVHDPHSMDGEA